MSRFIRKVKTASGATAVQIITKQGRERVGLEHIGSARTQTELDILVACAKERLHEGQLTLFDERKHNMFVERAHARFLLDTLTFVYSKLGFDCVDDLTFKQMVCARIIEPASKRDTVRILENLGLSAPSSASLYRSLRRCVSDNYRAKLTEASFAFACPQRFSLVLYDVTTLYFETMREDTYKKSGFSKERRLEPQITIGLLVDERGFPLDLVSFEGNKSETLTMIPVLEAFKAMRGLEDIIVVADAAMLSSANLEALEALGYHYIVSSRISKCPYEIECFRHDSETECLDGQIFESKLNVTINHKRAMRRVIYQYKAKRARLDILNIDKCLAKAEKVIDGTSAIRKNRFIQLEEAKRSINWNQVDDARRRAGIKGYVTNLDIDPLIIINAYHQLFEVERSFRMAKSDLKARPIFHHTRDAIEAHLTVVFAALAIARYIQDKTTLSIKKFVQKLSVIYEAVISINDTKVLIPARISPEITQLVKKL